MSTFGDNMILQPQYIRNMTFYFLQSNLISNSEPHPAGKILKSLLYLLWLPQCPPFPWLSWERNLLPWHTVYDEALSCHPVKKGGIFLAIIFSIQLFCVQRHLTHWRSLHLSHLRVQITRESSVNSVTSLNVRKIFQEENKKVRYPH